MARGTLNPVQPHIFAPLVCLLLNFRHPVTLGPAAAAAVQQPPLVFDSSRGVWSNSYQAVPQQQCPQQQVLDSPFLPFGGAAPAQPQLYLDPFFSGLGQQQVQLPLGQQHLLDPQQVPQPWQQQAGQHLQQLPQQGVQQQEQLQQQPGTELEEADEDFGDLCDLLDQVEQQYELGKRSQQQQGGFAAAAGAVQPGVAAEAAAVDMTSAPRPYEVVYDRERKKQPAKRSGTLYGSTTDEHVPAGMRWRSISGDKRAGTAVRPMVRRQQPQDRQMVPHAACIPVMQLAMPPPPYMQMQPQHLQQLHVQEVGRGQPPPWATSWASAVSQKHPNAQLPSRLVVNGTDSSSDTPPWRQQQQRLQQEVRQTSTRYHAALRDFASRHGAADRQDHVSAGSGPTVGLSHRVGSSGSQQQQQPSASARAAAMLQHASSLSGASGGITGGAVGPGGSRSSPEAYFRRHVPQIDPFWASATPDDVGLAGVTQLQPASAAAAGSSEPPRQSCTMSVLLTNSQLGMVKGKMATLQVG
jgi:hypothetical protein